MIKHLVTLMWNQKKSNGLILLELIVTFLVLFALVALLAYNYRLYELPTGFNVENNWVVTVRTDEPQSSGYRGADHIEPIALSNTRNEVKQLLEQMEEVEAVHTTNDLPYIGGRSTTRLDWQGGTETVDTMLVSEGLPEDIGMILSEGRWFGPEDEGQDWRPVIINKQLKNSLFQNEAVLGIELFNPAFDRYPSSTYKIVGVFEHFRRGGEFSLPRNVMIERDPMVGVHARDALKPTFNLIVQTGEEITDDFEERLFTSLSTLQSTLPILRITIAPWTRLRQEYIINKLSPLIVMAVVALFILIMVGFGLFGVLWQNVTRRTREIGVRRAMGATALAVQAQITLEIVVLSIFAIILGFAIVVQLPVSGYIAGLDWALFWSSFVISSLVLACLCALSSLYPAWSATTVDPVDALHYE